ncbi:hypothetical protein AAC387_Pa04g1129 [Persea americana]
MGCTTQVRLGPGPAQHDQGRAGLTPKRLGPARISNTGRAGQARPGPGMTGLGLGGAPCQQIFTPGPSDQVDKGERLLHSNVALSIQLSTQFKGRRSVTFRPWHC